MEKQEGRTVLDGVPGLAWGRSGETTFIGAMVAALAATSNPMDYRTLMGCTSLAFRVRWFQGGDTERWCPSTPVGEFPDELEAARKATGWELRNEWEPLERFAPDIVRTIDAGLPVLAYDPELNMGVIAGYEDEGRTVLMRTYTSGEDVLSLPLAELKMAATFLGERREPLTMAEAALYGIRLGIRQFRRRHDPPDNDVRGYWHGPLALSRWAKDIAAYDQWDEAERRLLFFVSWWNFDVLADARGHAGPWLRMVAPLLPAASQDALVRAAGMYEEEARVLSRSFTHRDAFLGPWSGGSTEGWTEDVRAREQEILHQAVGLETEAIDALDEAVTAGH